MRKILLLVISALIGLSFWWSAHAGVVTLGAGSYQLQTSQYFGLSGTSGTWLAVDLINQKLNQGQSVALTTVSAYFSYASGGPYFVTAVNYSSTGLPTNDIRWLKGRNLTFQSTAGNTLAAVFNSVGTGETLDLESMRDPNFATPGDWQTGTNVAVTGGQAVFTSAPGGAYVGDNFTSAGNALYLYSFNIASGGPIDMYFSFENNGQKEGYYNTTGLKSGRIIQEKSGTPRGAYVNVHSTTTTAALSSLSLKKILTADASGLAASSAPTISGSFDPQHASYTLTVTKN